MKHRTLLRASLRIAILLFAAGCSSTTSSSPQVTTSPNAPTTTIDGGSSAPPTPVSPIVPVCRHSSASGSVRTTNGLGGYQTVFTSSSRVPGDTPKTDATFLIAITSPGKCTADCTISGASDQARWISMRFPKAAKSGTSVFLHAGDLATGTVRGAVFTETALDGASSGHLSLDTTQDDGFITGSVSYNFVALNSSTSGSFDFLAVPCSFGPAPPNDAGLGTCKARRQLCANDCCDGLACDDATYKCCAPVQKACSGDQDCCQLPNGGGTVTCGASHKCCMVNAGLGLSPCVVNADCCNGSCIAGPGNSRVCKS